MGESSSKAISGYSESSTHRLHTDHDAVAGDFHYFDRCTGINEVAVADYVDESAFDLSFASGTQARIGDADSTEEFVIVTSGKS